MNKARGLTLLELLVTLCMLSVLLGISLPDYNHLSQSLSGDVTLRKLATAVQLSKSTAIATGTTVTLCRSADGLACNGRWEDGVIVFTDHDRDGTLDDDDTIVRHVTFGNAKGRIVFRAFQNKQYLQLTGLGVTAYQNGNFTYCPYSGDRLFARQLIINRTGRLRFALDSDGDGIKEDSRGRPLNCS